MTDETRDPVDRLTEELALFRHDMDQRLAALEQAAAYLDRALEAVMRRLLHPIGDETDPMLEEIERDDEWANREANLLWDR